MRVSIGFILFVIVILSLSAHASLEISVTTDKSTYQFGEIVEVYVSLYKNFNAPSGAILAGSKSFCYELYHTRRMFGGGMPQVWPFAAVALHYVDSFIEDYKKALIVADRFMQILQKNNVFHIEKIPNGTKSIISGVN